MRLKAISSAGLVTIAVCFASTAFVRPMQGQERMVEWSAHPLVKLDQSASTTRLANVKEAVEIVEVKVGNASITVGRSFLAGDDWLRGLCFRMKNVSGRPIIGARLSFSLPETLVDNNGLGFSLEYGRGESTGIPSDEQEIVMPDEEFENLLRDLRMKPRKWQMAV